MDTISPKEFQHAAALDSRPIGRIKVRGQMLPVYVGLIAGLNEAGFGIILDSERREHPFTFSAIVHYRGESGATLATRGVIVGGQVHFAHAADKVVYVEPRAPFGPTSSSVADSRS